jgi:hypothetical protein
MENENKAAQDCGCAGGDCCQPAKKSPLSKIVFIFIIVAALAIAAFKLFDQNTTNAKGSGLPAKDAACCDTTMHDTTLKACDPAKNPSCCPKK